ncbi:MAG: rhomboid family intramembrane serine protease [Rikenellaceae bacterium]|jgi:membrane associated rhomboid family serine protease|nr:rhomboid family intramembrane serine protease [Rikenellaceae bacterium]
MITYLIIGVTVACSLLVMWRDGQHGAGLALRLAMSPWRVVHGREWHRVLTHGFVHADLTHLLVNMFTFWSFGVHVEQLLRQLGYLSATFLALYFGGMAAASVYDLVARRNNPHYNSIGASGAVSAVLFASIFFGPWDKVLLFAAIPMPGIVFGVAYLLYEWWSARRQGDGVNHLAHICGAIFGFAFPLILNPGMIRIFLSGLKI